MKQDRHQRAKERYSDVVEAMQDQWARMREDIKFSNPANPQQWGDEAKKLRTGRPCLTFDHTNKFRTQVVNDFRGSPPSIQVIPADSFANAKAAQAMNGRLRHIEYASKANIAYETAMDHLAGYGLGWLRVVPEVVNQETNYQEPRILRIKDPLSCALDPDWSEPDGSDAEYGFVLSPLSKAKFKRLYPKSVVTSGWTDEFQRWTYGDFVLLAEYFEIQRTKKSRLLCETPDGDHIALTEDEYWQVAQLTGVKPEVIDQVMAEERSVIWSKMTGCEELEETTFPSQYIPLVPCQGDETWDEGKRYLSGLVRKLRDGQQMHNAEMSAYVESALSQPKAPLMVAIESIEGHEAAWKKMNTGNPAFLPFNAYAVAENGEQPRPLPTPQRMQPPTIPSAFAQGATMAISEMESAVGMFKSALGAPSSAVSGRAKQADRRESDVATFHYPDNMARSLEHMGRILIDMDQRLADTARNVRTRSEDGNPGSLRFDPQLADAASIKNNEVEAVNPRIGQYDVVVKVGPSYLTQREEVAAEMAEMFRGAPQLLPVLGPMWIELRNLPNADLFKRLLLATAPPQVQQIYGEEDKELHVPPAVQAQMQQLQQQVQQLGQALEKAAGEADKAQSEREKSEADMLTKGYSAVTDRLKVLAPGLSPEAIANLAALTVGQGFAVPPTDTAQAVNQPPVGGVAPMESALEGQ